MSSDEIDLTEEEEDPTPTPINVTNNKHRTIYKYTFQCDTLTTFLVGTGLGALAALIPLLASVKTE